MGLAVGLVVGLLAVRLAVGFVVGLAVGLLAVRLAVCGMRIEPIACEGGQWKAGKRARNRDIGASGFATSVTASFLIVASPRAPTDSTKTTVHLKSACDTT